MYPPDVHKARRVYAEDPSFLKTCLYLYTFQLFLFNHLILIKKITGISERKNLFTKNVASLQRGCQIRNCLSEKMFSSGKPGGMFQQCQHTQDKEEGADARITNYHQNHEDISL